MRVRACVRGWGGVGWGGGGGGWGEGGGGFTDSYDAQDIR